MKKIKIKVKNYIYNQITKWYVKLTNERNRNFEMVKDSYDFYVIDKFKGCNLAILNPIQCIYFALIKVYATLNTNRIYGISVDYDNDEYIKVNIQTERPGFIIGYHGETINTLRKILTEYFGKKVEVNIIETKYQFINKIY